MLILLKLDIIKIPKNPFCVRADKANYTVPSESNPEREIRFENRRLADGLFPAIAQRGEGKTAVVRGLQTEDNKRAAAV